MEGAVRGWFGAVGEVGRDLLGVDWEATLRQMPAGVMLAEAPSGRVILANEQVAEILGAATASPEAVTRAFEHDGGLSALGTRALERALRDGQPTGEEDIVHRREDGRRLVLRVSAGPIRDEAGAIVAAVLVLQDVTARVRDRRLLSVQRDVLAGIAAGDPLARSLEQIALSAEEVSGTGAWVSLLLVDEDGRHLRHGAAPSLPDAYNEAIDGIEIGPAAGSCGTAAHRGETVVVVDTQADPLWQDFRELADEHGLRACWSTPIHAPDGSVLATLAVYHDRVFEPSPEEHRVVELVCRTAAIAIERDRDARARTRRFNELQSSLLPRRLPRIEGIEVAAAFHSGDRTLEVGGDFYDVFPLGERRWGIVIGDVCGHGAEAAAVTALTRHTVRAVAALGRDPAETLVRVSEALLGSDHGRFATAIHGQMWTDRDTVRLRLAIAGHPPPLLRRGSGEVFEPEYHPGPVMGVWPDVEYVELELALAPDDALLLYTDGLVERNPRAADHEELAALLSRIAPARAGQMLVALEQMALGPEPRLPRDDVAALLLRPSL